MSKTVTTDEMCKHLGVDRATLQRAVADGCPVAKQGKGRSPSRYDSAKVSAWFLAHGKNPKGLIGNALQSTVPAQQSNKVTVEQPNRDRLGALGIVGALERARQQEINLSGDLQAARRRNDPSDEIASLNSALIKLRAELRQQEMSALEYQKQTGALCDYAEMQRLFVDLASGVRERIMALPNELAPALREYLRDPDDAGKVRDEIDQAIRHALAALPDELPEKTP